MKTDLNFHGQFQVKKKKKKSWTNFYQVFDLSRFGSGGFNKQM